MRPPAFWARAAPSLAARLLQPVGAVYGAVTLRRMAGPRIDCGAPVICVGNFTAGGAGKTPVAIHVAQLLLARGENVFFLSRGYGGAGGRDAPLRVDPAVHAARDVGDEPLLLARTAPVIVAADRVAGARAAKAQGATVIVMDDGLQSGRLRHNLALGVIDAAAGFGNGLCVPAGPLRAPLAGQLKHVSAQVLIGPGPVIAPAGPPVFRASLRPDAAAVAELKGRRVLAFAGIGRPEKFFATLAEIGAKVALRRVFADHHAYAARDLAALSAEADGAGLLLATTEKDTMRLPADWAARGKLHILPVSLQMDKADEFAAWIGRALAPA